MLRHGLAGRRSLKGTDIKLRSPHHVMNSDQRLLQGSGQRFCSIHSYAEASRHTCKRDRYIGSVSKPKRHTWTPRKCNPIYITRQIKLRFIEGFSYSVGLELDVWDIRYEGEADIVYHISLVSSYGTHRVYSTKWLMAKK